MSIPFTQGCFVLSLVEIGQVVVEKKILKVCQCIFAISLLSPLGKGCGPSFEQTWIPFTKGCFVPSWNWSSGSGEEDENGKSLRQRGITDKFWSEGELKSLTSTVRTFTPQALNVSTKLYALSRYV